MLYVLESLVCYAKFINLPGDTELNERGKEASSAYCFRCCRVAMTVEDPGRSKGIV